MPTCVAARTDLRISTRIALAFALLAGMLVALTDVTSAATAATAATPFPTPVQRRMIIGHSVLGRPIIAYRLGDPAAKTVSVILGQMHGDEHAGVTVADSLIHGSVTVEGIALWVIPTMNPDGDARHTRQNAHGVDLNRNWPQNWAPLTGQYYSGPHPLSEPETRAMYRFLRTVRPRYVVSIHQPLDGVDTTAGTGPAYRAFREALGRNLGLPQKNFQCWSVCHGSMSAWYQSRRIGVAVETVEFGWHPTTAYLTGQARRGIIAALHGRFGSIHWHDPHYRVHIADGARTGTVSITGWARDPDAPSRRLTYRVTEAGRVLTTRTASAPNAAGHGLAVTFRAASGPHRYCVTILNVGAGTHDPRACSAVRV